MLISNSKSFYSLPKTQPTSSSSKSRFNTHSKILYEHNITCPQISHFHLDHKQLSSQKYIHNMKIDYGKLSKPYKDKLKNDIDQQLNLANDLKSLLSTKKIRNIKQFIQNQGQNVVKQPPIHSLLTQKKVYYEQKQTKKINPQSGNKPSTQKKKNRILSVKAYEALNLNRVPNQQKQTKINHNIQQINHKIPQINHKTLNCSLIVSQQNTNRTRTLTDRQQKQMKNDSLLTQKSQRKISHSRIIKTFNPTAGMQTKIITYPDLSEFLKLRQSRKK